MIDDAFSICFVAELIRMDFAQLRSRVIPPCKWCMVNERYFALRLGQSDFLELRTILLWGFSGFAVELEVETAHKKSRCKKTRSSNISYSNTWTSDKPQTRHNKTTTNKKRPNKMRQQDRTQQNLLTELDGVRREPTSKNRTRLDPGKPNATRLDVIRSNDVGAFYIYRGSTWKTNMKSAWKQHMIICYDAPCSNKYLNKWPAWNLT